MGIGADGDIDYDASLGRRVLGLQPPSGSWAGSRLSLTTMAADSDEFLTHRSHDLHFLARLERVSWREADVALRLYHEPELVRALLAEPSLPPDAERVALALAPGEAPPFIVVAREGGFVTCLGAGMHPGELPVLAWERVTIHLQRADRDAKRRELALSTLREQGTRQLMGRLASAGARLSREDFQQLIAIEPLLHRDLVAAMVKTLQAVVKKMYRVARIKRPSLEAPLLRNYWNAVHGLGHLLMLTSHDGRRSFEHIENKIWDEDLFEAVYLPMISLGYGPLAFRALWAIGRAGKLALPTLKRVLQYPQSIIGWSWPVLGLVAIAMRHQRLRAEALGVINVTRMSKLAREDPLAEDLVRLIHGLIEENPFKGDEEPAERQAISRIIAGTTLADAEGHTPLSVEEMMADELVIPRLAHLPFDHRLEPQHLRTLLLGVVALSSRSAEEFYLPADAVSLAPAYSPEATVDLAQVVRPRGPVRAQDKPGRNASCPCGSGKKYKKCCGGVN